MLITGFDKKYPEELIKDRSKYEGQVVGLLAKDLLFLDECHLDTDDFKTVEGRMFFNIEKECREKGYNTLDEVTILTNVTPDIEDKFNEFGGAESLLNLAEIVDTTNSDSILDLLHRENILLKLYDKGFNLFNEVISDKTKKAYRPIDKFRKMNSEDLIAWYEVELSKISIGYNTSILEEKKLLITDEALEKIYAGEENGVPFGSCGIDINGDEERVYPYCSRQLKGLKHGTSTMLAAYSSVGKTSYWMGVIFSLIDQGEKVLIFSNEQESLVFIMNAIIWLAYKHFRVYGITKEKLTTAGNLTTEDKAKIKEIVRYYNEHYAQNIEFIHLPKMDMRTIESKTRYYSLQEGFSVVLVDTLKSDFSDKSSNDARLNLIKDTEKLDEIAKKYDLIMLESYQCAPSTLGKLFLDVTCLSEAKAAKNVLENLMLMRITYPEEFNPGSAMYCEPFQYKITEETDDEGNKKKKLSTNKFEPYGIDEYGNDRKGKIYRMFFIDKCRSGKNSGDSGEALLLEFDAAHCVFKEVAYCKPKRMTI